MFQVEFGKTPTDVYIKNVIVPDNYRPPSKYYDIALIELEDIIPFKVFTNPSCIWPYEADQLFGKGYESGWGVVESGNYLLRIYICLVKTDIKIKHSKSIFKFLFHRFGTSTRISDRRCRSNRY